MIPRPTQPPIPHPHALHPLTSRHPRRLLLRPALLHTFPPQVPLPFPCCTSRQIVYRRVVTLLSPIECSIDDIGSRIVTMRDEVRDQVQAGNERKSDARGLTRLVQGSVLPQVRFWVVHGTAIWQHDFCRPRWRVDAMLGQSLLWTLALATELEFHARVVSPAVVARSNPF